MLPVMLVRAELLTLVIVASSLAAVVLGVQAGVRSASEDLALNATKSSTQIRAQSQDNGSAMASTRDAAGSRQGGAGGGDAGVMVNDASLPAFDGKYAVGTVIGSSNSSSEKSMGSDDKRRAAFWSEDIQVGCRELRARRYISDGFCTSEKPVKDVVCAGHCLPIMNMPWYAEFVKTVARTKLKDWQCVEDLVKKKRVKLLCQNGSIRVYRIKVVKSCKCKKIVNRHNRTSYKKRNSGRRRRRKDRKNQMGRGS